MGTRVIEYSPARYRLIIGAGAAIAATALIAGLASGTAGAIAAGAGGLLLVALYWRGVSRKLRGGVALAREGDLLVGGELPHPLPIAGTTYRIASDHGGSWIIELHAPGEVVRLGAGGWRVRGARFVTRAVAERALRDLGLTER